MAGRTNMLVGYWKNEFTHVPIPVAVSKQKQIDPQGRVWLSVLAATGQPTDMGEGKNRQARVRIQDKGLAGQELEAREEIP